MKTPPITAFGQGTIARALLAETRRGTVAGVTSRGVFINLDSGWILFLSFEPSRGPLTLNLCGGEAIMAEAEVGGTVEIQGGKIQGLAGGVEKGQAHIIPRSTPPLQLDLLREPGAEWCVLVRVEISQIQVRKEGGWGNLETLDIKSNH